MEEGQGRGRRRSRYTWKEEERSQVGPVPGQMIVTRHLAARRMIERLRPGREHDVGSRDMFRPTDRPGTFAQKTLSTTSVALISAGCNESCRPTRDGSALTDVTAPLHGLRGLSTTGFAFSPRSSRWDIVCTARRNVGPRTSPPWTRSPPPRPVYQRRPFRFRPRFCVLHPIIMVLP